MAASKPTSYPSLTSSWTPASSCVTSTGFWYAIYATGNVFSDMFGMPSVTNIDQRSSPTGGCVPPSYTLSVPYLTDGGCPTSYSAACSTRTSYAGQSADLIWCCPSVEGWNFNCAPAGNPAPPYGCQASFTAGAIITGSRTDLIALTGQAETHTVAGDHGVNAWGIALLSTPASSTSTVSTTVITPTSRSTTSNTIGTSTSTSPTLVPTSSGQGLSTAAEAGIGVGVGIAALVILGLLMFWLLRRKYKAKQQQLPAQSHQTSYPDSHHAGIGAAQYGQFYYAQDSAKHTSTSPYVPSELSVDHIQRHPQEMQG
ncbi:hypothetical protein F5Y19DRAFT_432019 [Xylariaceae sp. FL1651]|nr:hypothetical protein F5Y19DRAFT_432019 [Xylariaceae sp. FL1651]